MRSGAGLITCLAIVAVVALLAVGLLLGSGPVPLQAQEATGQGERIDARLLTNTDDKEGPSPVQYAALDEISRQAGGKVQADFNPLNGTPRILFARGAFLSGPSTDPPRTIARNFLLDHADLFAAPPKFVSRLTESRVFKNENSGITHVQYQQQYEGLEVFQSTVRVAVTAEGRALMVTADYYPELSLPSIDPALSEEEAMDAAFAEVGHPRNLPPPVSDPDPRTVSMRDLYTPSTERVVFPLPGKSAVLAWRVVVPQFIDFWEVVVDANSGAVLYVANRTVDHTEGKVFLEHPDAGPLNTVPFEGPLPAPRDAWVGTSSILPACSTCTNGNNAFVGEDRNDNLNVTAAFDSDGHFNFGFSNSYALTGNPDADENTSITNLFYLNNVSHDHFYQLGFTEAAGNFQDDNFGAGGVGGDPVAATTYTGWDVCNQLPTFNCRNNAWFSTPPDGSIPVMQTFLFTSPRRDPSLDGDIVIHEYGHGVSSRLVGVGGLSGIQSGAMGEGWSDYFAASLIDDPVIGEYASGNPTTGGRRYAYDSNPLTYGDLCAGGCEVHDDGEIWAATLWDLRALYVSQLGLVAGSQAADELVIEGLMLTPPSPSMLDARNAILQAQLAMSGANRCAVWQVFADRGMGYSATSAGDTGSVAEAFDMLPACSLTPDPGALSWGDGRIDVFALGSDNALWHKYYARGQGWSGWEKLGGILNSGPAVSSWGEGRLDVFALATDDKLRHKWYVRGQGWSQGSWENLGAPQGDTLSRDPGVVSWGDGRIDIFARGPDNALWHKYYARGQGWSGWENLGGILNSGPAVSSWGEGRLDVFALDTDDKLRHKYFARGQGWSGWENLEAPTGRTLSGDPGVVTWGDGRIDVFAQGSDNALWHKYYARGQGWSGWENLGGTLNSGPAVSSWGEGRLDIFALGTDDKLRHKWYVRGQGWSQGLWEKP